MATNRERLPRLRIALSDRAATLIFHCAIALAVLPAGLFGVLHDSWRQAPARAGAIHALFGVLLLLSVIAKFAWQLRYAAFSNPSAVTAFARHLSRQLFLLLYILAGSKEIQYFLASARIERASSTPDALSDTMKVLQFYLGIGLLALAAIWILAALCRHSRVMRQLRLARYRPWRRQIPPAAAAHATRSEARNQQVPRQDLLNF